MAAAQVELFNLKIFQNNSQDLGSSSMLSFEKNFVFRKHAGSQSYFNAFLEQIFKFVE